MRIILLVTLIASLCGCDLLFWEKHADYELNFSILLPRYWDKEQGILDTAIIAFAPQEGVDDKFRENINVMVKELPEAPPVEILFELNKEELLRVYPGVKYDVLEGKMLAGKEEGKWLEFVSKTPEMATHILTATWIKSQRVYVVTCVAEETDFSAYERTFFRKMLRSFRIW